jgi:hypothetical protein
MLKSLTILFAVLVFATSAMALEKTPALAPDDDPHDWAAVTTITVSYYNYCTGWVWIWGGWSPGEQIGTCFDLPGDACCLKETYNYFRTDSPSAYGFTGTITIETACDCSGYDILSQPWLPLQGWNSFTWNIPVTDPFLVKFTWAAPTGFTAVSRAYSDHPAVGPTGPQACGTCYPTTRVTHSFYYGINGTLCPGTRLSDGVCDIEWVIDAALTCTISVEESSWGAIKGLYK